jgi:hypothetical protein
MPRDEEELNQILGIRLMADRQRFEFYYAKASPSDALEMDTLLLMRHTLALAINSPTSRLVFPTRASFANDEGERLFCELRERVQRLATFLALSQQERHVIESEIFSVEFADEN